MRENNKISPVGGVDREKHIDKISLKNAVETPFWMAVWAAEPERKISVEMSYSDLKIITDLIDDARLKRSKWITVKERMPKEFENELSDGTRVMGSDLVQVTVMDLSTDKIFVADDCTCEGKWCNYEETTGMFEVLAWQPMAEPYCPADEPE